MGIEWALASSSVSQSLAPVRESKARNRLSFVAPTKSRPPAVAMVPPMFKAPVSARPASLSGSMNPRGTLHATSPRLTSTATSSPNGGAEQGILFSGFQNRPTTPPQGVVRSHVGSPPPRGTPWTIRATCPRFIRFVNTRPCPRS